MEEEDKRERWRGWLPRGVKAKERCDGHEGEG